MDGVIYFGSESIDLHKWINQAAVHNAIEHIKRVFLDITANCNYIKIEVPIDWAEYITNGVSFWDNLDQISKGDSSLVTYVATQLFDAAFNQNINKSKSTAEAIIDVVNNNPDLGNLKYFSVLSVGGKWQSIPIQLHVENHKQLYNYAINVLENHPVNEKCFTYRATCIFSNINFHNDFSSTLRGHGHTSKESKYGNAPITGIQGFSKSVTATLKAMHEIDLQQKDTQKILAEIKALSGFDCTPEGGKSEHLNFNFQNTIPKELNCEFHVKIHKNNNNDGVYYQDRVYFGFYTESGQRRIAVAHSGKHL